MEEIWKDIEEYEWAYQVSNLGRVRSKDRVDQIGHPWYSRIIKPFAQRSGYLSVSLSNGKGKKHNFLVHRLVAKAFIENSHDYPEVNHIDENKANNAAVNLEWCTSRYNINYGTRGERQSETQSKSIQKIKHLQKLAKSERKQVDQYNSDGVFVKHWDSMSATTSDGFSISGVSACCLGKAKHHHGYIFKFARSVEDALEIVGGD